jgi:hypothetical protein
MWRHGPTVVRGIFRSCVRAGRPHIWGMRVAHRILGLLLVPLVVACGSNGQDRTPASLTATADQRLQGNWRLATFEPFLAMEQPLKELLQAQLNAMSISFENGQYSATGPGVTTGGPYTITGARDDTLTVRVYDRAGVGYNVTGTFVGARLQFTSEDSPWGGRGVLERQR